MYTTCLFCQSDLGRNGVIEAFPVGRRLAYDQAKGRLWVVCRRCERWNLTPQEERWEAMEQAERLYRGTRLRASTDNVGLARMKDGTELVRIGAPLRPEFAAWRYGDQFGRRRTRNALIAAGGTAAVGALVVGGATVGVSIGAFGWLIGQAVQRALGGNPHAVVARLAVPGGIHAVKRKDLGRTALVPSAAGPFGLRLPRGRSDGVLLEGDEATRAAAILLPVANRFGGSRREVGEAVARIEAAGGPEGMLADAGRDRVVRASRVTLGRPHTIWTSSERGWSDTGLLAVDKTTRLALEMALHEDQERRAMAGELAPLQQAWQQAEEIAAIADDLLLPDTVAPKLDQLRARSSARAGAPSSPTSDNGAASSS